MITQIKTRYQNPNIAIIGAAAPDLDYNSVLGIKTGFFLRRLVENKPGRLFSGGVSGIGLDAYKGAIYYCMERKLVDDKFFLVFPDLPYKPPQEYFEYAAKIGKPLEIVSGGKDMLERRTKLAEVADLAVVLNGSLGTLDEALQLINRRKTIFCLNSSGGAAKYLGGFQHPFIRGHNNLDNLIADISQRISS